MKNLFFMLDRQRDAENVFSCSELNKLGMFELCTELGAVHEETFENGITKKCTCEQLLS